TFSKLLTDNTRPYIAVDSDTGAKVNPMIVDASSPLTVFTVYAQEFGQPQNIVLQPSNFGYQAQIGQPQFLLVQPGEPDQYQEYFPNGAAWVLANATLLQSTLSASDTSTQFWMSDIGAHLVLKTGGNGAPTFWAQVRGFFDS